MKETKKEINIEERSISDLIPDDRNFNRGTERGQRLLQKSLNRFGAGRSILVDKAGRIIAGNKTVENATAEGINGVIVVHTDGSQLVAVQRDDIDLDSAQGREMALADNATGKANLDWDTDTIREQADAWEFDASEWDDDLTDDDSAPAIAAEDEYDESDTTGHGVKRGDIWILGNHRLMCDDSTDANDVAELMNGQKADLVFTDPPYGVAMGDKNKYLNNVAGEKNGNRISDNIEGDTLDKDDLYPILVSAMINCREACKDDASYYVTSPQGGELFMMMMMMMSEAGLPVRHVLIWEKNMATFSLGRLDYDYQHEPILYTWTKKHHNYRGGEFRTSIWRYDKPMKSGLHPTMKPVALVANCINDGTLKGDLVLDLFGGSGTTIMAAEQTGRKCFMMEMDEHYCDVIISRWGKYTGEQAERQWKPAQAI